MLLVLYDRTYQSRSNIREEVLTAAGENIKLKAEIQNGSDQNVWLICRLLQVSEILSQNQEF